MSIRDFYEANKGALKMAILMIIITIVIVVITSFMNNMGKVSKPTDVLEKMGADYYENYLYPSIIEDNATMATVLAKYSVEGIKVTVKDFMSMYKDYDFSIFKKGKYASCDFDLTYVTIYPVSPYEVDDYKMDSKVYCDVKSVVEEEGKKDTGLDTNQTTAGEGEVEKR